MDDSAEQLHRETDKTLYDHVAFFTNGMQRASSAYTKLDSEWRNECFMLTRTAWCPSIEGLHGQRIVLGRGMTRWHIWDLSIVCNSHLSKLIERCLSRHCLRTSNFWWGGLSCPQLLIWLREFSILQFLAVNKYLAYKLRKSG